MVHNAAPVTKFMKQYYIHKNGEQSGPYPEAELLEKLENRELSFNDMCWCEGMGEWQALHETIEMPEMAAPPPAPATPPPPPPASPPPPVYSTVTQPTGTSASQKEINWTPALVTMCVAYAFGLFSSVIMLKGGDGTEGIHMLALLVALVALGFFLYLHYQCWEAVSESHRSTTPGKAAGFLLIPFFNFYWAFITWPKLMDNLNAAGVQLPNGIRGLSVAYAVIFVCSLTIGLVPGLDVLFSTAGLVLFILLYKGIVGAINQQSA